MEDDILETVTAWDTEADVRADLDNAIQQARQNIGYYSYDIDDSFIEQFTPEEIERGRLALQEQVRLYFKDENIQIEKIGERIYSVKEK